jgi:hypothetical protein
MEVSGDSKEDEAANEDMVSFVDVMDAADRAADALEHSRLSRVSDLVGPNRSLSEADVEPRKRRQPMFSPESSETEYSSDSVISISIDGPMFQDTCECVCSVGQGSREIVLILLSSDSDDDVEID